MRNLLMLLLAFAFAAPAAALAPCPFVGDPQELAFTNLDSFSVFLYRDVMDRKSLTSFVMRPPFNVAGKRIVRHKFARIGIPDPAAARLEFAVVARPVAGRPDKVDAVVVLKGDLDYAKFLAYGLDQHKRYMIGVLRQGLVPQARKPREIDLAGRKAVVFPFTERDSEFVMMNFAPYTLVAMAPAGNYDLLAKTVDTLEGRLPAKPQPDAVAYKVGFQLTGKEKKQLLALKNARQSFKDMTRENYMKLMEKAGAKVDPGQFQTVEDRIRERLVNLTGVEVAVDCAKRDAGYATEFRFRGTCASAEEAEALKAIVTEQLVKGAGSCLTPADAEAYRGIRCYSEGEAVVFEAKVPAERDPQYHFVSMLVTMFFQDKRFTDWFHL